MPVSPTTRVAALGALIAGWNTPSEYRRWLWLSASLVVLVFVVMILVMWPLNGALYAASLDTGAARPDEVIRMAHRWVAYDWLRVVMMAGGFISAVWAISPPIPP